MGSVFYGMVAG